MLSSVVHDTITKSVNNRETFVPNIKTTNKNIFSSSGKCPIYQRAMKTLLGRQEILCGFRMEFYKGGEPIQ